MSEDDDFYTYELALTDLRERIEIELQSAFDIDPEINAIDYLKRGIRFLFEASTDPLAWKWVVIALHGALYGFCVGALRDSDPDLVKRSPNSQKIIDFETALKRCQDIDSLRAGGYVEETPLELTKAQEQSIAKIHKGFRNLFEHFPSEAWTFTNLDIAEHVGAYLEVIEQLIVDRQACFPRLLEREQESIKSLLVAGKAIIEPLVRQLRQDMQRMQELPDQFS